MKMIFEPFQGERVNDIDSAIRRISDHISEENPLEIKEIHFCLSERSDTLFSLKYKLEGFGKSGGDTEHILMLDETTFKEAKKSWVDFFR
ncbi:MAG: hypothetical protein COA44_02265 [Arcobacter sp.]|nr:MAG: hypothetical protein COA44_02265 [Arcobacter sp.]